MVSVETELSTINKLVGKKLTAKQIEEILFELGFELEEVQGDILKIDITAERPDLLSSNGIARTLKAYLGLKIEELKIQKSGEKVYIKNTIKEWPYAVACIVKGLKFDDQKIKEIIRIQEKLGDTFLRKRKKGGIGLYPLEKIKFPVTFTAEDPKKINFIPLESNEEMNGYEILKKHSTGIKYKSIIEKWEKYPIFIDANKKILSMPPIINSHDMGRIDETTTEVFVETTGTNLKTINLALQIITDALIGMGGKAYSIEMIYGAKKITAPSFESENRTLKVESVNKLIGMNFKAIEIKKLLEKMGYKVKSYNEKELKIIVNTMRSDIWHDVDVIDDIARAYGFNNLQLSFKHVGTIGDTTPSVKIKEELSNLMIGLGYQEAFTLILTNKETQFEKMNIKEHEHIKLGTSVEQAINMMRFWLTPELIKCLENNRSAEYPQKFFEINYVTIPDGTKDVKSKDLLKLSVVTSNTSANFTEVKQVLDVITNILDLKYETKETEHGSFINGRAGKIIVNGKEIGIFGEIHPKVLNNFGLEMPVAALEINLSELLK